MSISYDEESVIKGTVVDQTDVTPDPFSAQGAPGVQLIVQMRIYDVLLGIYTHLDPEKAEKLADVHRSGAVLLSSPNFVGRFIDDELYGQSSQVKED